MKISLILAYKKIRVTLMCVCGNADSHETTKHEERNQSPSPLMVTQQSTDSLNNFPYDFQGYQSYLLSLLKSALGL